MDKDEVLGLLKEVQNEIRSAIDDLAADRIVDAQDTIVGAMRVLVNISDKYCAEFDHIDRD